MKKIAMFFAALTMITAMGCSGQEEKSGGGNAPENDPAGEAALAEEKALEVTFTLSRGLAGPGEIVQAAFNEALPSPGRGQFYITIVLADAPEDEHGKWQELKAGAKTAEITGPASPGNYEARLFLMRQEKTYQLYQVISRAPLSVRETAPSEAGTAAPPASQNPPAPDPDAANVHEAK